ncbi:MAG: two-component regulator propeller domain-containing protein [Breznakibacter sp.]
MKRLGIILGLLCQMVAFAQEIYRFEHFDSRNGLSQNTVFSLYCDSKGFLWIGTWNGLNRYDGKEFKVYKSQNANTNLLTNNRIIQIWEDRQQFIWMKTYDGYYHYFNPRKEVFNTLPEYTGVIDEKNSVASCFLQQTDDKIWIGTTNSGAYLLTYNKKNDDYTRLRILDRGAVSLSNNKIRAIYADKQNNVWISTKMGLNKLNAQHGSLEQPDFQHLYADIAFTSAISENANEIWFGTEQNGIAIWNKSLRSFRFLPSIPHIHREVPVTHIFHYNGIHLVTFAGQGIWAISGNEWTPVKSHDRTLLEIYPDQFGQLWLTGKELGVTRVDLETLRSYYYEVTSSENKSISDLERQYFFEDNRKDLWIGLHGGGLALYNRQADKFKIYKNNPPNANSLSSNVVLSIAQDNSGQMWLGTGLHSGGLEKVVMKNPAFGQIIPKPDMESPQDNVTRALFQDRNNVLWAATKGGKIYLFRPDASSPFFTINLSYPAANQRSTNVYAITQDHLGYIWLGSKGDGIARSNIPVAGNMNYGNLNFKWETPATNDTTAFANRNIYSLAEDKSNRLWIGTFGAGIFLTSTVGEKRQYTPINSTNSNLSSNQIRHLYIDDDQNLWAATTFGVNMLEKSDIEKGNYTFKTILHNPQDNQSLSYNDVVHVYQDSRNRFWFTTFGGGVNMLESAALGMPKFKHYTSNEGLSNDVVFGATEDNHGKLWFGSENGLTRLDPQTGITEMFDVNNGLGFSNFSENTVLKKSNGNIVFGGNMGFITIDTEHLHDNNFESNLEFTNLYLMNKKVDASSPNTPLSQSIDHTQCITLKHYQSGFGIDFAALDFQNPQQTQYSYRLVGFDQEWVNLGNFNKATYTNLPPGKYRFEVKWTNRNGQVNKNTKVMDIVILPPWYKTTWAYIGFLLFLAILTIVTFRILDKLNTYKRDLLVEKRINLLKLQFFTNVSHEIRTPLTLIIGPIEDLLVQNGLPRKVADQLRIIKKNAGRMLMLTNQLLDFRKVQNNKMVLNVKEFDIVAFTKEIFNSFQPLASHKHIDYRFNSDMESQTAWADTSKIDIIIYNLLSNALKFTEPGKKVEISIKQPKDKNEIHVSVHDQGRGIPESSLGDLFTRYTILSNNELSGTGIGLSLSYELAKLHGGDIKVESQLNTGSNFTFIIPTGKAHFENNQQANILNKDTQPVHNTFIEQEIDINDQGVEPTDGQQPLPDTILIVEDNPEILNYIATILQSKFHCIKADNGTDAVKLAVQQQPSLVLTDVMMPPGMSGIEMTQKLKENYQTCHIPVVMLTAKAEMQDQLLGIETGAEAYLTKPFRIDHLKAVIHNILAQRKLVVNQLTQSHTSSSSPQPLKLKINSKDEEFLQKLTSFIEDNFDRDITIDQLAEHCCLSRTVFYTKLKNLTGLRARWNLCGNSSSKIAATLLDKGYNVSEVAFKIGFNDVKYFSRQFKTLYGYPPSQHAKPHVDG